MDKKAEEEEDGRNKTVQKDTLISETRYACTQAWFSRAKWETKLHFLLSLLKLQKGMELIQFLSQIISTMSKDSIYAMDSKTSSYDICTKSNDSELDPATLQYMMKQDIIRFAGLDQEEQIDFLTGIVRIGGIALARRALKEIETNLSSKREINSYLQNILNKIDKPNQGAGTSNKKKSKNKQKKVKGEILVDTSNIEESEQKRDDMSDNEVIIIDKEPEGGTSAKIQESPQVKAAKQAWLDEMNHIQKQLDSWNPHERYTDRGKALPNIEVDILQDLPLWKTRYFTRMLPSDTQREIKKLNGFWSVTVDAMQKEQNTQAILERQILKNEAALQNRLSMISGIQEKSSLKTKGQYSSGQWSFKKSDNTTDFKTIPRSQKIMKLLEIAKSQHAHTYNDQYCMVDVCHEYHASRVMACCSKKNLMAVTTPNHSISFYSLLTGAKLTPSLVGHTGLITSLCFHQDGDKIFSGSSDLTISCWNIWSRASSKTYLGHKQCITCLHVNKKCLVSGSMDGMIKVYNILSAQNIATYTEENPITCIFMDTNGEIFIFASAIGEIKLYNNQQKKERSICTRAHNGRILAMNVIFSIIFTGGDDGFARAWSKKSPRKCLVEMNNNSPVQSIILSNQQIICGCESGHLKIWCPLKGTLLHSLIITHLPEPILQVLSIEENPSKVVIATESWVKIVEFYTTENIHSHSHHTTCCNDPTKTTYSFLPACQWTAPRALTETLMQEDRKRNIYLQESYYHKRLQNLFKYHTDKNLRKYVPANTQESIFIDALRTIPQYSQLQYGLTSFPRNTLKKASKCQTENHGKKMNHDKDHDKETSVKMCW